MLVQDVVFDKKKSQRLCLVSMKFSRTVVGVKEIVLFAPMSTVKAPTGSDDSLV
jgi:hypothetical protein